MTIFPIAPFVFAIAPTPWLVMSTVFFILILLALVYLANHRIVK